MKFNFITIAIIILIFSAIFLSGVYFLPWDSINWGKLQLFPSQTVTVFGAAKTQQKSQVATFTAGVNSVKDNKDEAVSEVNQKIDALVTAVKKFGIKPEDIKTQNLSIYRQEESYWENDRQKTRPGQWRVDNSVEITLRDVNNTSSLMELLSQSGATNVYGPNFALDDTKESEKGLLQEAIKNATEKAQIIAQSSGKKLGKLISVNEGQQTNAVFMSEGMGAGGGGSVEPGTGTVSKTVTVVFELK